ncbi:unnamed protein product [Rotaria sp. Silwood2]|nr:unnamed protein product [Rotaria sp. Silwood2]
MLFQELHNYFTLSIKRCHVLREALDKSPYGLNIKSVSDTRWTANYGSILAVIESYDEIIYCFQLIEEGEQFDKESKLQGEKHIVPYDVDIDKKFNRLHRFRQPSRRIDPKPTRVVQLTK